MSRDPSSARILLTGDYPVLESTFFNEVKAVREREPFDSLLVLVSSKLLGLHLRRLLVEQGVAHFNLRFWTLEEFARQVSTSNLLSQGKTELPSHADELLVGNIVKSLAEQNQDFYFHDIADRQGFHRAILATFRDLKDACLLPADLERILGDAKIGKQVHLQKLKDLLKIWKAYEERFKGLNGYDESDLMMSAYQWAKDSICLKQTPKMVVYGFYDFNTVQKRLLQACMNEKETIVFLPYESTHAFEFVKPTIKWLKDNGFKETCAEMPEPEKRRAPLDHLCHHLFNSGENIEPFYQRTLQISPTIGRVEYLGWKGSNPPQCL